MRGLKLLLYSVRLACKVFNTLCLSAQLLLCVLSLFGDNFQLVLEGVFLLKVYRVELVVLLLLDLKRGFILLGSGGSLLLKLSVGCLHIVELHLKTFDLLASGLVEAALVKKKVAEVLLNNL